VTDRRDSPRPRVLVVEARFYADLADAMAASVTAILNEAGADCTRWPVPGAFELPAAIRLALLAAAAGTGPVFDGFVALGCVIRGETDHYDYICREVTRGLMDLTLQHGIALGFGVLTCQNYALARVRAAADGKNKGADAANACLRMMALRRELRLTTTR
jgi:6,7-dimethyl-8-ribityllumazine synthase